MSVRSVAARSRAPRRLQLLKRVKGVDILFTLLAILGSVHVMSMLTVETYRTLYSTREIERLMAEVAVLQDDVVELSAIAEHANDELYLEQLARCYGYAYPDERRYLTPSSAADGDEPATVTPLCR